jgi:hypothetical protein
MEPIHVGQAWVGAKQSYVQGQVQLKASPFSVTVIIIIVIIIHYQYRPFTNPDRHAFAVSYGIQEINRTICQYSTE